VCSPFRCPSGGIAVHGLGRSLVLCSSQLIPL
jgi:hypothetical protein